MGAAPMIIDPKVLAQLPEDMQRELLAGLPSHKDGLVSREATPQLQHTRDVVETGESATEHMECGRLVAGLQEPREVWAVFEAAIDGLATQTQPKRWQKRQRPRPSTDSDESGMHSEAIETDLGLEKLAQLCNLIGDWGRVLADDNLEGLQFVMRRVQRQAQTRLRFQQTMQSCLSTLQQHALHKYGAKVALEHQGQRVTLQER